MQIALKVQWSCICFLKKNKIASFPHFLPFAFFSLSPLFIAELQWHHMDRSEFMLFFFFPVRALCFSLSCREGCGVFCKFLISRTAERKKNPKSKTIQKCAATWTVTSKHHIICSHCLLHPLLCRYTAADSNRLLPGLCGFGQMNSPTLSYYYK